MGSHQPFPEEVFYWHGQSATFQQIDKIHSRNEIPSYQLAVRGGLSREPVWGRGLLRHSESSGHHSGGPHFKLLDIFLHHIHRTTSRRTLAVLLHMRGRSFSHVRCYPLHSIKATTLIKTHHTYKKCIVQLVT